MLTISLRPARLTTAMENLYSLKGIKLVMVVRLTLPSICLNGVPIAGNTSTSIAVMGVYPLKPVSQDRDTSFSPMLVATRLDIGPGGTVVEQIQRISVHGLSYLTDQTHYYNKSL